MHHSAGVKKYFFLIEAASFIGAGTISKNIWYVFFFSIHLNGMGTFHSKLQGCKDATGPWQKRKQNFV